MQALIDEYCFADLGDPEKQYAVGGDVGCSPAVLVIKEFQNLLRRCQEKQYRIRAAGEDDYSCSALRELVRSMGEQR